MIASGPLRVLIVDDEPLARRRMRQLLADIPAWTVTGEAGSAREAVAAIRRDAPDVVLLDIQLTDQSGFDVISGVGMDRMPAVVFVTAYDEFALRAFDVHAIDYLLKPLDGERLHSALDRAARLVQAGEMEDLRHRLARLVASLEGDYAAHAASGRSARPMRIMVRQKDSLRVVSTTDVHYFEAAGNYVRVHLAGESHLVRTTLQKLEEDLDPAHFVRIHRSTLLNLDFLDRFRPAFSGDWQAVLRDGTRLRASRLYVKRMRRTAGVDDI